ncbi:MAG: formylglycine-generating enzyme family protein, partial [Chitinophagales bacterium]
MKRTGYPLAIMFILAFASFAPSKSPYKFIRKQGFVYIPSGNYRSAPDAITSIQGFYMSSSEITNEQYREYLLDLKSKGKSEELLKATIDKKNWLNAEFPSGEFAANYDTDPAYDQYPVVNISQEAAILYCTWLENKFFEEAGIEVQIRLPFETEWKYAAHGGSENNIYAWQGSYLRNKKGCYLANLKTENICEDGGELLVKTGTYMPNDYGLYNMCGNAAEWISAGGRTKGGSWWSKEDYLKIDG